LFLFQTIANFVVADSATLHSANGLIE